MFGLARQRPFPALSWRSLQQLARTQVTRTDGYQTGEAVFFLSDPFSEYFQPEAGLAALRMLAAAGCQVQILPVIGSGRTLISKGFLEPACRQARRLVETITNLDPTGQIPIVGVEPSEIASLRDEYLDLLPGDERCKGMAERAFMIDEFMIRPGPSGKVRLLEVTKRLSENIPVDPQSKQVLLHGHCYQKAQPPTPDGFPTGVPATVAFLEALGLQVKQVNSGCCGMAGAFGYEKEHYEISQQIAEQVLLPAVRKAGKDEWITASGVSCQAQIEDGTGRAAFHPIIIACHRLGL